MAGSGPGRVTHVAVVEARAVVREGLRTVIDAQPDLAVVADSATVGDARRLDAGPDVVVTDITVADRAYDELFGTLRCCFGRASILVFTPVDNPAEVRAVLSAGASGYLLESAAPGELVDGIRTVANGDGYLQPSLGVELARFHVDLEAKLRLSSSEEQVLRLLALGHTNKEIAQQCSVSLRTAESLRAHIQRKVDRRGRVELMEYAREVGLL